MVDVLVRMAGKGQTVVRPVVLYTRISLATYMVSVSTTLVYVTRTT